MTRPKCTPVETQRTQGWLKRQHCWRHNGLRGSVRMCIQLVGSVQRSPSVSDEAKRVADDVERLLHELQRRMQLRVDPEQF